MTSKILHYGSLQLRPIFSSTAIEAKRSVLKTYKLFYRQIPLIVELYNLPITVKEGRQALRNQFYKQKDVKDIQVIDCLIVKAQNDLVEMANVWSQSYHVLSYLEDATADKKPEDFLSKFYAGQQ